MVAEMNRVENAARLAMGDHGGELVVKSVSHGMSTMVKISFLHRNNCRDGIDRGKPVLISHRFSMAR